jgi:addiction module HigA family antidote
MQASGYQNSGECARPSRASRPPGQSPGTVEGRSEEFLRPQQITQVEAARQLRVSTTRLNEFIRGKRGITADTAWRLGDWLGTGPDVWMNLQSKWDLWQARKVRKTA